MTDGITVITDTATLEKYTETWRKADYITVDTEFMRERTYWPQLCLVQVGGPDESVIIDPLADGIDLTSLFSVLNDEPVLKVFHAARQDIELFHHMSGHLPEPLFDTQVAAMVCGFGDSVGYEKLASKLANATIDKTLRFTDWSHRPLSDRQLIYALSDVSHLRLVFEKLSDQLEENGRREWLDEEMASLLDPAIYAAEPDRAWRRIKTRGGNKRFFVILEEVAAWREAEAQRRDMPRGRIVKDEAITEIAALAPKTVDELARVRALSRKTAEGKFGEALLGAVQTALARPENEWPTPPPRKETPSGIGPIMDLLKVLLKAQCEKTGVAQKLVANTSDLEKIAALGNDEAVTDANTTGIRPLQGWRREMFGELALALMAGRVALTATRGKIHIIPLDDETARFLQAQKEPKRRRRSRKKSSGEADKKAATELA